MHQKTSACPDNVPESDHASNADAAPTSHADKTGGHSHPALPEVAMSSPPQSYIAMTTLAPQVQVLRSPIFTGHSIAEQVRISTGVSPAVCLRFMPPDNVRHHRTPGQFTRQQLSLTIL